MLPPLELFGTTWHRGHGAKSRMQSEAACKSAECQVQVQDPDSGHRQYGCYATWDDALHDLRRLRSARRHVFELIPHGQPCKPYLDLDAPSLPPCFQSLDDLVASADRLIAAIFASDYGIQLRPEEHLLWLVSPQPNKVSLHLVVCTRGPQHVYRSNHQSDPQGASHLAQRLRQLDPEGVGALVDVAVYTKDREMRAIGASKFGKSGSALVPYRPIRDPGDTLITRLDPSEHRALIQVPEHIPRVVRTQRRGLRCPEEASEQEPHEQHAAIVTRMLDLLQQRLHPSAYHDRSHGGEDPFDPLRGVKFNYRERTEPCYTAVVHEGTQNLRCYVDAAGDIYARCFSCRCAQYAALRLGRVREESDAFLTGAVRVNLAFMQWPPSSSAEDHLTAFDATVRRWLQLASASASASAGSSARPPPVLSLRSPMGTGKSTFLDALLAHVLGQAPATTVLVVTYRQSLAAEHTRKMAAHCFVSYQDVDRHADLSDRARFPRVICQIESLKRLGADQFTIPRFDFIILDEVESVLRHFASPTVRLPEYSMELFVKMLQGTRQGVVTLDAAWGALTHCVLQRAGLPNLLVVNDMPPSAPRTFAFTNDEAAWQAQILEDLSAGLNVVVVTLSSERAYEVRDAAVSAEVTSLDRVLVHTSKTGDELKRRLRDVDALWKTAQLVVYSPTIAAGVDFSSRHFDRMYFYACAMSALPSTALQMLFRVRHVSDPTVRCCTSPTMRVSLEASRAPLTSREMARWLRWMAADVKDDNKRDGMCTDVRVAAADPLSGEPAPVACLRPLSYWLVTMSFVEAERYNACADFVHEFGRQAEAAGHKVTVQRVARPPPEPDADRPQRSTALMMLAAVEAGPAITTPEEFEALRQRVVSNQASGEDKWRHYVELYKTGWGVDRIDAAFLAANGTQPASPRVKLLARVLCPGLRRHPSVDVSLSERTCIFKVPLVEEVVDGLGLASPFDTETVIEDLMGVFDAKLRHTTMFRDYNKTARLFRPDAASNEGWDLNKVVKAVNMVMASVGLSLILVSSKRVQVAKQRVYVNTYRLDADAVANMVELVKLRLRRVGPEVATPANEHARACLEACTLPRWGHLVDPEGVLHAALLFVSDEEDV